MDRRRFVPSAEGLEVRTLMATNLNSLFGLQVNSNLNIPITYQQTRTPNHTASLLSGANQAGALPAEARDQANSGLIVWHAGRDP